MWPKGSEAAQFCATYGPAGLTAADVFWYISPDSDLIIPVEL